MNNLNETEKDNDLIDSDNDNEVVISINPLKFLFTLIVGWIVMPLLLSKLISSELIPVYIIWFYAFFNIKIVFMWIGYLIKAPLLPIKVFKFSFIGKISNLLYVLLISFLQIAIFTLFIKYIYINQVTSIFAFLLVFIQPLLSDLASAIGNALFFK